VGDAVLGGGGGECGPIFRAFKVAMFMKHNIQHLSETERERESMSLRGSSLSMGSLLSEIKTECLMGRRSFLISEQSGCR